MSRYGGFKDHSTFAKCDMHMRKPGIGSQRGSKFCSYRTTSDVVKEIVHVLPRSTTEYSIIQHYYKNLCTEINCTSLFRKICYSMSSQGMVALLQKTLQHERALAFMSGEMLG